MISAVFRSFCVFLVVVSHEPKLVHANNTRDKNSKSHTNFFFVLRHCIVYVFLWCLLCANAVVIYY